MRREALGSSVCLRPAVPADSHFAYLVLEQTMRGYAEATWGEWHDDRAREEMRVAASDGRSEIIEVDGERAGFLRAVLRVNPAKALYERHGFGVTAQDPIRFFMERPL